MEFDSAGRRAAGMTPIVVSGALANKPLNGGEAWVRLSWILALQQLGFDVYFFEQLAATQCVDKHRQATPFDNSVNLAYFQRVLRAFGLADRAMLLCDDGRSWGLTVADAMELAASAALVNISGHLAHAPLMRAFGRRIFVDIDPGFTQFWHLDGNRGARLAGHDVYFTIAENIGQSCCSIPSAGIPWRPIRQPVVLDHWPMTCAARSGRFTTVSSWRGPYGRITHDGHTFGLKAHEFRKIIELPGRVPHAFELALAIDPGDHNDLTALRRHGWHIVDPRVHTAEPETFREYVQQSSAECSVAQGIYVDTQSGWISDRTVRYLASGKPALVQDTGFGRTYPVGCGLVPFRTLDDAVAGAKAITQDYDRHSTAARQLAETYFTPETALASLVNDLTRAE